MGEYGSKIPDQNKVQKILDLLCGAAYRPLEDELTRSYILTAITKLHASMSFIDHDQINAVMTDYS